ncbi:long chain acyl-CoA synthetase 6, peroxisomal-like protein [Tanacetum coccineum]
MFSAALPLSVDVLDFLRMCFGCIFLETYEMTENFCAISNIDLGDNLCGRIGFPSPSCEIKLVDVLEMDYTATDKPHSRAGICVKGETVFQGYYKDEFHFKDVNKGKHSRTSSSKKRRNDEDMNQELAEEYMDMIQDRGKSKGAAKNK